MTAPFSLCSALCKDLRHRRAGRSATLRHANSHNLNILVDCIHWTSAAQLSLLEDEMRRVERVNEEVRMRMVKQKNSDKSGSWSNLWGNGKNYQNTEEEAKERAKRTAAAAKRWREYSRKGADRPPTFKLPGAISNLEQ